ncbi:MAG: DUF302 domain-containing protein [Rhodospirillales bacterium]|nr:DUF302 domain-containing protein [Rhodospirillales bacterium]
MTFGRFLPMVTAGAVLVLSHGAIAQDDWIVKSSPHSVPATVEKLKTAIEGAGAVVAAVVDHAAAAQKVGMELSPTTVVIFGNPKLGTPLMIENPKAGIDLPLKVLVWQDGASTMIGYLRPDALAKRHEIDASHKSIEMMTGALAKMTDAATAQ